jgi:hypothetical protein
MRGLVFSGSPGETNNFQLKRRALEYFFFKRGALLLDF